MHHITKLKLAAVHQICDVQDKSTEFMIQYMQDTCKVDHDTVIKYLTLSDKEHTRLFNELNGLLKLIIEIDKLN
jgi:hypothetical protein